MPAFPLRLVYPEYDQPRRLLATNTCSLGTLARELHDGQERPFCELPDMLGKSIYSGLRNLIRKSSGLVPGRRLASVFVPMQPRNLQNSYLPEFWQT